MRSRSRAIATGLAAAILSTGLFAQPPTASAAPPAPVLHYDFESATTAASGTLIEDVAANFDGTVQGSGASVVSGPGGNGSALRLPGGASTSTAAYVTLPPGVLTATGDVTMSAWVDWDGGQVCTWAYALGTSSSSYLFATPSCGGNLFGAVRSSSEVRATATGPLGTNWSHVAVVLKSGQSIATYLNGVEVARSATTLTGAAALGNTTASGYLGRSFFSADPNFAGAIDDFRVYNAALSSEDLLAVGHDTYAAITAADAVTGIDLGDTSAVTRSLTLPTAAAGGSTVTWASSNPGVVSPTGAVTRPAAGQPDANVTLTPTYTIGDASTSGAPITVTVKPHGEGETLEPVHHYPLTSNFNDTQGGAPATARAGASVTSGVGVVLDGVDDYLSLPNDLMTGLDEISVSMDVNIRASQATPYFIWTLGRSSTAGYLFTTGDTYRTAITTGGYATEQNVNKGSALPRDRWVTLTYTLDSAGVATLYQDGVQVARATGVTVKPRDIGGGTTSNNLIGRSQYSGDKYLAATVRDFRIYDKALTADELGFARARAAVTAIDLGNTADVATNLSLPTTSNGLPVVWSSSDPGVVDATGTVTLGASRGSATLTATTADGGSSASRDFAVTMLPAASLADYYQHQFVLDPVLASGTQLPSLPDGVELDYAVSGAGLALRDGALTAASDASGTVTATIDTGVGIVEKEFAVRVLADANQVLGYTRAAKSTQEYAAGLANSLHLGLARHGDDFVALHDNTGVLFATGLRTADHLYDTTTLLEPWIFHDGDGGYGVVATIGNASGAPLASKSGRLAYFTSEDLRQFTYVGDVGVSEGAVTSPRVIRDTATHTYLIGWRGADGAWRSGSVASLFDAATGNEAIGSARTEGPIVTGSAPLVDFEGARPVNEIIVDDATADALEVRFGRIYNDSVSVTGETSTTVGQPLDLSTVKARLGYTDGTEVERQVDWDAAGAAAVAWNKPGTYTVTGTVRDQKNLFPLAARRADPTIIYWEGRYIMASTWDDNNVGSVGLPIRVADTIAGLADAPEIRIVNNTQSATDGTRMMGCFWAPDIMEVNGGLEVWFAPCYGTAAWNRVVSTVVRLKDGGDPANPADWGKPLKVLKADGSPLQLSAANPGISLDMTHYQDKVSGTEYAVWSQRYTSGSHPGGTGSGMADAELWIAEYDSSTFRLKSEPKVLNPADLSWEQITGDVTEGAYFTVHGGRVWLTYSASNIDATYAVGLMSAPEGSDLTDLANWTTNNAPVVKSNPALKEYGPGHSAFFNDEFGDLYFVYHAKSSTGGSRDAGVRQVFWAADGQPILDMTDDERIAPVNRQVSFTVTVEPGDLLDVSAVAVARWVAGKAVLAVSVTNGADKAVSTQAVTAYGTRLLTVQPGRTSSVTVSTRVAQLPTGSVSITASDGTASRELEASYAATTCG